MPVKHAYALQRAIEEQGWHPYVWIVQGSEHTQAVYDFPADYQARLAEFFGSVIGVPVPYTAAALSAAA